MIWYLLLSTILYSGSITHNLSLVQWSKWNYLARVMLDLPVLQCFCFWHSPNFRYAAPLTLLLPMWKMFPIEHTQITSSNSQSQWTSSDQRAHIWLRKRSYTPKLNKTGKQSTYTMNSHTHYYMCSYTFSHLLYVADVTKYILLGDCCVHFADDVSC